MPTNRGNLIVSLCYMKGNEGSPYRQTDLVLVSPRKSSEKSAYNFSDQSLVDLLSEPIQIRAKGKNTVSLTFSSDARDVLRYDPQLGAVPEVLLHTKEAADLSPLAEVGSVLLNHDPNKIIGVPVAIHIDERAVAHSLLEARGWTEQQADPATSGSDPKAAEVG